MADSKQTELCTCLAAILLAALVMVPIIAKEGIEGLRGETCCDND